MSDSSKKIWNIILGAVIAFFVPLILIYSIKDWTILFLNFGGIVIDIILTICDKSKNRFGWIIGGFIGFILFIVFILASCASAGSFADHF